MKYNESKISLISPILNYDLYNARMDKSIEDKLFFLDKIDFDVIVDFGCANGALLSVIMDLKPNVKLIGYDIDKDMLDIASNISSNILFTNDWDLVLDELKKYKKPLLNLSSVIHEVYSYSNTKDIRNFWIHNVFGGDFKYIVIRDMIPSSKVDRVDPTTFKKDVDKVKEIYDPHFMESFESIWGSLYDSYRIFIHFLLKYRYTDNWNREVYENYVPVSYETIKTKIPNKYKIIYEDHFILPFIQNKIIEDFGIKCKYDTHTKYIIENVNY